MSDRGRILIFDCEKDQSSLRTLSQIEGMKMNSSIQNGFVEMHWDLDSKYYSTQIDLICIDDFELLEDQVYDSVIVIKSLPDEEKEPELIDILSKMVEMNILTESQTKLVLDVSTRKDDDYLEKTRRWCLENGVEIVQLYNCGDYEDYPDNKYKEYPGLRRIEDSLMCHEWPNMKLKKSETSFYNILTQPSSCSSERTFDLGTFMDLVGPRRELTSFADHSSRQEYVNHVSSAFMEMFGSMVTEENYGEPDTSDGDFDSFDV